MKSLQTIQALCKVGEILSKVVFICSIVGFCLCAVGVVSLALGAPTFKLGGITIESILQDKADLSEGTLYASMAVGGIFCAGYGVLAKFAARYFERELADGTPFTFDGAKQLLQYGVLTICIPVGGQGAARVVQAVLTQFLTDVRPWEPEATGSAAIGILLILMSLLCKYGAEMKAAQK